MLGPAVELAKFRAEVRTQVAHGLLHRCQMARAEHLVPVPWGRKPRRNGSVASVSIPVSGAITEYRENVQLRYNYRLDPQPRHRAAFGKAFGCARVVFNDGLAARHEAHQAGQRYLTDAELSARLTAAKATQRAGVAGRGVGRGPPAGPRGPEHRVPELFRLAHTASGRGRRPGRPGSGPARTPGRRSGSPLTPGSRFSRTGSCACRRSGTCRCGGRGRCRLSRPASP